VLIVNSQAQPVNGARTNSTIETVVIIHGAQTIGQVRSREQESVCKGGMEVNMNMLDPALHLRVCGFLA